MVNVLYIDKIGPYNAEKLHAAHVRTIDKLLEAGATPASRRKLAEQCGASEHTILEWVNRADLYRIRGIGEEYADLLEVAGVDRVGELARRNPENLHQTLVEVNAATARVRRLPTIAQVTDWIAQANTLPRMVSY
jgi:predicted flap endonuclease-1-like 5' DNA nuclease